MSKFKSLLALAVLACSAFAITGCSQIDSGNVGVVKSFGKTSAEELPQGTHLTWLATVDEFTSKEVSLSFDNMKPKAHDNLTISDLDVDIYYQANPSLIAETVVKYQGDVVKHKQVVPGGTGDLIAGYNRVSRAAREAIYQGVAEFPATTMHTKRSELADRIQKILQKELDTSDKGAWTVTGVNVRGLVTDPAIESSIRAAAETDQAIARANKEKELAVVEAAKAREVAKGQADANNIVAASLTPQLIRLKEIEAQKAFAGAGTHTVLMGQGGGSLINVGK
jgi:prohibitin 1